MGFLPTDRTSADVISNFRSRTKLWGRKTKLTFHIVCGTASKSSNPLYHSLANKTWHTGGDQSTGPCSISFRFLELADYIQGYKQQPSSISSVKQTLPLPGYRSLSSIQGKINRYFPLSNVVGPRVAFSHCLERR